jgi:hypothetical protein
MRDSLSSFRGRVRGSPAAREESDVTVSDRGIDALSVFHPPLVVVLGFDRTLKAPSP